MDQNEDIFVRFMNDVSFQKVVTVWMANEAYRRLRVPRSHTIPTHESLLRFVEGAMQDRYVTCVPFVPLKIAAGAFSDPQQVNEDELQWVEVPSSHRLRQGMFVSQVVGKSMEPNIPDGGYCLFRSPVEGTRQGKMVLVQFRDITDSETGQRFTVKTYHSEKVFDGNCLKHKKITLSPMNPDFDPILIPDSELQEFRVIAELIEVIG